MPMKADEELSLREVAEAGLVSPEEIAGLITERMIPRGALRVGDAGRHLVLAAATPAMSFACTDGAKIERATSLEVMEFLTRFVRRNWDAILRDPGKVPQDLHFRNGPLVLLLPSRVTRVMARLNLLADAKARVVMNPARPEEQPVIRGTCLGVFDVAHEALEIGAGGVLARYPALSMRDVNVAMRYAMDNEDDPVG